MGKFTDEQMIEIGESQERLLEWRRKFQPYDDLTSQFVTSILPETRQSSQETLPVKTISYQNLQRQITEQRGLINYTKDKIQEHLSYTDKKKKSYGFDSIEKE